MCARTETPPIVPTATEEDPTMSRARQHHPPQPIKDVPEEFEPGALPVEPDEGPVPALFPEDPEHERVIDPGANRARAARGTGRPGEVAGWP